MTIRSIGEFHPVPERPGMRTRALIATEHGFTSCFVAEFEMDQGASIPLHTHPIEEGFVVTEGAVTIQLGERPSRRRPGPWFAFRRECPTRFVIRRSIRRVFSAQRRGIERTSSERPASISRAFHGKSENLRSGSARGPMSNTST
jgi:Cupin domain